VVFSERDKVLRGLVRGTKGIRILDEVDFCEDRRKPLIKFKAISSSCSANEGLRLEFFLFLSLIGQVLKLFFFRNLLFYDFVMILLMLHLFLIYYFYKAK
jgi:hypothetical protein